MTKRIYIDVDGVLNAWPGDDADLATSGWGKDSWNFDVIYGYGITWSDELVSELNALQELGVEFRWLTTWCELAQQHIAPGLGLEGGAFWPLAGGVLSDFHSSANRVGEQRYSWWKQATIINDLTKDPADKVVWIDDDHSYYNSHRTPWTSERVAGGELLTVVPYTPVGVTPADIKEIRAFLELD